MTADSIVVDEVCRICLKQGKIPIYGKHVDTDFSFDVRIFGDIELSEEDRYPKHLCISCHALLQSAKIFRKAAKLSEDILKKYDSDFGSDDDVFSDDFGWESDDYIINNELSRTFGDDLNSCKDIEDEKFGENYIDKFSIERSVENLSCAIDPNDIIDSKDFECESKINTYKQTDKDNRLSTAYLVETYFKEVPDEKEDSNFKCRLKYSKYQCKVCAKIITKQYCKEHYALHDPNVPKHACNICGKYFLQKVALLKHKFIHSTEFKFKCKLCPYKGRSSTYLKTHMRTHLREYRYFCNECPAKFLTKSNFNRHLERHKEPRYNCEACDKSFRWKCRLKHHYDTEHLGLRSHICTLCGKGFSYRKDLRRHEIRIHKSKKKGLGRTATYMAQNENTSVKDEIIQK